MGVFGRLAVIVKSLLSATSDKLDRIAAEEELRAAKAEKEALEELGSQDAPQVGRESTLGRTAPNLNPSHPAAVHIRLAADYKLLGLKPSDDLQAVESAWRELARRADPKRFPAGSEEEKRAAAILTSVNEAYARIREAINPTEGRFGRLEL